MKRKFELLEANAYASGKLKNEITDCLIDIISTCNLSCPSCPQGQKPNNIRGGQMKPDLFRKIVSKLKLDFPHLKDIHLFNWTEPLLHNKLSEFVEIVKKADFGCYLSANLNHIKNLEEVIKKNPDHIRVSLSGFTQEIYQIGHQNGNIETVKQNMRTLSNLIKEYHSSTRVTVIYLKYKHNLSEIPAMKEYTLSLGFNFQTFWSYLMPVEKLLQYVHTPEKIDKTTMDIVKSFGNEPREFLNSLKPHDNGRCHLLENQLVLNSDGEVQLCCASQTPISFKETYLNLTPEQIFTSRHNADICRTCMKEGIHTLYRATWSDDELVIPSKTKVLTKNPLKIIEYSKKLVRARFTKF